MNPNVWKLHASVFELARARGLGAFRVDYKAHPGGVVIELVMEGGAGSARSPACDEALQRPRSLGPAEHGA